jgi:hypothetical protein
MFYIIGSYHTLSKTLPLLFILLKTLSLLHYIRAIKEGLFLGSIKKVIRRRIMFVTHFYENKTSVLSQLLVNLPTVEENIKIKGRKAKVVQIVQIDDNNYQVSIIFEKVPKKQPLKEIGKKKR